MRSTKSGRASIDRYKILIGIMIIVFVSIVVRLVYLQVFNYDEYKQRADTRSMRFLSEQAPRGKIYDSNGDILATNRQTYTLTFTETDESKKNFYTTIDKVYAILKQNNQAILDNFKLRIDENGKLYFDVSGDAEKLRFLKDRGLGDEVKNTLYKNKEGDLTAEEEDKIDQELLKITPEQAFDYLVKEYTLYDVLNPSEEEAKAYTKMKPEEITDIILKKYSLQDIRGYMVVKDAIKMQSFSGYKPVTIAKDINKDTAFIFYQRLNDLPGIDVSIEPMRYYPYNELGSDVLGYVSSINGDQKAKYEARGYDASTDLIGKAGIEAAFENELKGVKGGTTVKVNSSGRKTDELYDLESYPGNNVHLSIDKDIQYSAETMMKYTLNYLQHQSPGGGVDTRNATRGAAVAIEVDTGRVLALVSEPGFNPNEFAKGELDPAVAKEYFQPDYEAFAQQLISRNGLNKTVDDLFPKNPKTGVREDVYDLYPKRFYNYATLGMVAPGSTFKPVTSVAMLEDGVRKPTDTMVVSEEQFGRSYPEIFGTNSANWPRDKNYIGTVDLYTALMKSSNSYYFDGAVRLYYKNGGDPYGDGRYKKSSIEALDSIAKYAWQFGLGIDPNSDQKASTGLEISENFGQVYNFESYKKQTISLMRFTLVDSLEKGTFVNTSSPEFPTVNIGVNDRDSKELATAKESIKKDIEDTLNKIGDGNTVDDKVLTETLTKDFKNLYSVYPEYQESVKNFGGIKAKDEDEKVDKAINLTVQKTVAWVIGDIAYQIVSPRNLTDSAIGQSISNFTPVQLASYVATLANGGTRYKTHLVDKITDAQGNIVEEFKPEVLNKVDMSQSTLDAIKEGMKRVEQTGTASQIMGSFPISTAGKTGTATFRNDQSDYGRTDYGVYISFAPLDNPKIAVATVIYDGGHGYFGASVARAIYETYYREQLKGMGYQPRTIDGVPYDYSLNPPLESIKDGNINSKVENAELDSTGKPVENTQNNNSENKQQNNAQ
ncbi:penicillin-binding transpeptidase domain-containing protein [Clostridium sp. LIBA-8841]|uniref:penicillin-binding transpeptidase domain-containing protein n=1 Tax=Clostridium sp. LIBA-8841 TaxID=2987530 RepID=UPI002AC687FA|nr:penicillin-binding transpeptidase domain-containing protein [Clostridium sp. LIBA-8841]MDZ5253090.1 penicillin-binding transpeptidase domain-containing protein [Clostridium sp. LIBA-8841]